MTILIVDWFYLLLNFSNNLQSFNKERFLSRSVNSWTLCNWMNPKDMAYIWSVERCKWWRLLLYRFLLSWVPHTHKVQIRLLQLSNRSSLFPRSSFESCILYRRIHKSLGSIYLWDFSSSYKMSIVILKEEWSTISKLLLS